MAGIEKYTQPGILEDYCLGLLPENEATELTAAIKRYPELQQKVASIEQTLVSVTAAAARQPLKEKILSLAFKRL